MPDSRVKHFTEAFNVSPPAEVSTYLYRLAVIRAHRSDNWEQRAPRTQIRESQITLGTACAVIEKTQDPKGELTMSTATERLEAAQSRAMAGRPKVGGFPYLAETLRRAGVIRNLWYLPACQSLYLTEDGPVVSIGTPLVSGTADVPRFDPEALVAALRTDQAGQSTFPEFLAASWRAGVVRYDVDFIARTCTYYGADGDEYVESYPGVDVR